IEVFGPLIVGGVVIMLKPNGNLDLEYFSSTLAQNKAAVFVCVPSFLLALCSYLESVNGWDRLYSLRYFWCGGEAMPARLVSQMIPKLAPTTTLYNAYGPAECVVAAVFHAATVNDFNLISSVPIGKPLPG